MALCSALILAGRNGWRKPDRPARDRQYPAETHVCADRARSTGLPVENYSRIAVRFGSSMIAPSFAFSISRSEEHTSELQSLMRISYAVFCLKKKTYFTPHNPIVLHPEIHDITLHHCYQPIRE